MWEQEHGAEFQVNGQQFLEYVEQQWDQHHNEKEKEKLQRVSDPPCLKSSRSMSVRIEDTLFYSAQKQQMKKTKQTQEEMLYGTAKQTPSKRRLMGTPITGKLRKVGVGPAAGSSVPSMSFTFDFFCSVLHHLNTRSSNQHP